MTAGRLSLYGSLVLWLGGAGHAWMDNLLNGFVLGLVTTSAIQIGLTVTLVLMVRHDRRRGWIVEHHGERVDSTR